MAPRFKKNMFISYRKGDKTIGAVCFQDHDLDSIFRFRDTLASSLTQGGEFVLYKSEGVPTRADSTFQLIKCQDVEQIERPGPSKENINLFTRLLGRQPGRQAKQKWNLICKLSKIEMETSHDFPCLIIYSSLHQPTELSTEIKKVASALSLEVYENPTLEPLEDVVMSNRTFKI